jgi:hypothetical protein
MKMKKLLLTSVVAFFALLNVNAQEKETVSGGFAQGDTYISGTLNYISNTVSDRDYKYSEFTFSPSVGYFIDDNIALELTLYVGSNSEIDYLGDDYKYNNFGGGLGAVYFFTPDSKFSFTTGAALAYVSSKSEFNGIKSDDSYNVFSIGVLPGVSYFVSEAFALKASIGVLSYASGKSTADGALVSNTFNLNLDLSEVNFGLTYKF